ncbi:MAG: transcription elongation factor GreA [Fimbriimonadaceae bacterium]|nr:transcription elongation factor GreA [Fimbriimonadaceae bacterium]
MSQEVILSREGFEKLTLELKQLKGEERSRIAANIKEAKSHGDLRENAMYHEAKLNQKRLESRIAELEKVLQIARVMEAPSGDGGAHLGSKVTIKDLEWGDKLTIELVGAFESDPLADRISVASPLGSALMGKRAGDKVQVVTPNGTQNYEVIEVTGPDR